MDWKGIANYEVIHNVAINSACWIWFLGSPEANTFSAQEQGYRVEKIVLRGTSKSDLRDLVLELAEMINISNWHILPESETDFLEDPLLLKLGRTYPDTLESSLKNAFLKECRV